MPSTRSITIDTPCSGSHTVSEITPNLYVGNATQGTFTLVVLAKNGDCWFLTIYVSDEDSDCYPSTIYRQNPCNASTPDGEYEFWDGTALKPKLGKGTIQ